MQSINTQKGAYIIIYVFFYMFLIQRRWIYYRPLLLLMFCFLWFSFNQVELWRKTWHWYHITKWGRLGNTLRVSHHEQHNEREEEEETEAIPKGGGTLFWMKKREDAMFLSVAMTALNFPSSCPSLPDKIQFLCSFSHSMFVTVTPNLDWTPNFSTFPMDHQWLNLMD